jgi:excisionase family DNA binding protein
MDDVFLTTAEVLEYLQVNLRTVYRLLKANKLPAVRVGRQWRFRKADVDAWLESQRAAGDPAAPSVVPAAAAATDPTRPVVGLAPTPAARPRVLVADDEEAIRDLLAKTLELADYEVVTVPDGLAAAERLRTAGCDLLITDLKMPGLDGLGVIREARRLYPRLPVVIITGFSSESSAIEAINLGVAGYLTKPFRVAKVLSVAAQALGE